MLNEIKNISKNINKRKFWRLLIYFSFLIIIIFIINHHANAPAKIEVDFLDVGQGDASLIKAPDNKLILIDGGPDNLVLWRLGEVLPFYYKTIDYIILSHFHDDHINGLIEIFKRYRVKNFIYLNNYQSATLNQLLLLAEKKNINTIILNKSVKIESKNNCYLDLLNPSSLGAKDDQNNSVITKFNCSGNTFLLSGDNSYIVEQLLINSNFDFRAQVFKSSHHGSNSANSEIFLRALGLQYFIISSGLNNKFNHPNPAIIERARLLNINIRRTDQQGTIRFFEFSP